MCTCTRKEGTLEITIHFFLIFINLNSNTTYLSLRDWRVTEIWRYSENYQYYVHLYVKLVRRFIFENMLKLFHIVYYFRNFFFFYYLSRIDLMSSSRYLVHFDIQKLFNLNNFLFNSPDVDIKPSTFYV